jgi:starch phosphorylase
MLRQVVDSLTADRFCPDEQGLFRWIVDEMLDRGDRYFYLADLPAYVEASRKAEKDYQEPSTWVRKAVLNVARTGRFSSDRAVREYARDIWSIQPTITPQPEPVPPREQVGAQVSRVN